MIRKIIAATLGGLALWAGPASAQVDGKFTNESALTGSLLTVLDKGLNANKELPDYWSGTCKQPERYRAICSFTGFWHTGIRIDGMLGECLRMDGPGHSVCYVWGRDRSGQVSFNTDYSVTINPTGTAWSGHELQDVPSTPIQTVPFPLVCHPHEHC